MQAVELTGRVTEGQELQLDDKVPCDRPSRVRVIILFPDDGDIDERDWLRWAASSPSYQFLHDPSEDVYTAEDGEPFVDEG